MNENILELTIYMLNNLIDLVMFYYLFHCFMNKKINLPYKKAIFFIGYGIVMGSLFYYAHGYAFRVIFTILMICILKGISQKNLQEALLVYIVIFLSISFVQAPIILLMELLVLNQHYTFLLTQMLTLITVIFISFKIPLFELFHLVERQIVLRLIAFILIIITSTFLLVANFEYSLSYLLYFSIFFLIVIIILGFTIRRISFYTNEVPVKLHDVKNMLMGLHTTVYGTTNILEVRKSLDECLELMSLHAQLKQVQVDQDQENLLAFIQQKKENFSNELTVLTELHYYDKNRNLSLTMILYMLGVLLDNAMEHGGSKPILIEVSIAEYYVTISVANAYGQSKPDFNQMFKKGYSTKAKDGRGYGLLNLSKAVEKYGGEIILDNRYLPEYESHYLFLKIDLTKMKENIK